MGRLGLLHEAEEQGLLHADGFGMRRDSPSRAQAVRRVVAPPRWGRAAAAEQFQQHQWLVDVAHAHPLDDVVPQAKEGSRGAGGHGVMVAAAGRPGQVWFWAARQARPCVLRFDGRQKGENRDPASCPEDEGFLIRR